MKVKEFDHISIVTRDIKRCTNFYSEVFGFVVRSSVRLNGEWFDALTFGNGSDAEYAFLELPDGSFGIEVFEYKHPESMIGGAENHLNTVGLRYLAFEVDDIGGCVERLEEHGAKRMSEIVEGPLSLFPTGKKLCFVKALDDVIIELAQYGA